MERVGNMKMGKDLEGGHMEMGGHIIWKWRGGNVKDKDGGK